MLAALVLGLALAGAGSKAGLANEVMDALKKRIDPNGVKNYVWRPHGDTRLEIQMPLAGKNENSKEKRIAYEKAQDALNATNARPSAVIARSSCSAMRAFAPP